MIKKTLAILYDGNSSRPQTIELSLDTERGVLSFDSENANDKWELKAVSFTKKGTALQLLHGQNPVQNIAVEDLDFIDFFLDANKKMGNQNWYDSLLRKGIAIHAAIALFLLGLIGLSYLYILPWIAQSAVAIIPESYDTKMGEMFSNQNMLFNDVDSSKTKILNQFASQLKLSNTKPIKFTVVKSPVVNAYALPDGNIVFYTGIIEVMKTDAELVALIGHEVSHVNHRHSMKMLCRNVSGYLLISALLGDANGVMATIGDNVNSLQSLSFSREYEHEADVEGFKIVTQNHIDPQGMSNLFKRLDDRTSIIPAFLNSHPMTTDRIAFFDKMAKEQSYKITTKPKLKNLFKELKR